MAGTLLEKWLMYYDPIHRGWTPAGIANGVCATVGFSFPRIKGGYNLRRGEGGVAGAADRIVGAAGFDATAIRTFPWLTHAPSAVHSYRLCAVGGGGMENDGLATLINEAFDAGGNWVGGYPNAPADLRVTSLAGGRFLVKWTYPRADRRAEPGEFRVYSDDGAGQIDFGTPAACVAYRRGRFHYEYVSEPFGHGMRVRWAVRAATAAGVEESNVLQAEGWAEAQPPAANPVVTLLVRDA
jgi:hypothetical protein